MKIHTLGAIFLSLAGLVALGQEVNISGKWKASFTTPDGQQRENTFNFKVEGDTLTGTVVSSALGEAQITDGKVHGDEISFSVTRKIGDDEAHLQGQGQRRRNQVYH